MRESLPSLTEQVNESQKAFNDATYKVKNYQKEIKNYKGHTRGAEAAAVLQGALNRQAIAAGNLEAAQTRTGASITYAATSVTRP